MNYIGLDVSVKDTDVCIVEDTGRICWEVRVVSHPHKSPRRPDGSCLEP
nr:hypothetical protein [Mesorhizobium sp.]